MAKHSKKKPSGAPLVRAAAPSSAAPPKTSAQSRWIIAAILACTAAVYANSLSVPLFYDDLGSITQNPGIAFLWPFWPLQPLPMSDITGGRPLVHLTLAANFAFGGFDVRGYHLFNLALHLLSCLVLYELVRKTLLRYQEVGSPARASLPQPEYLAGAVALVWAVHPLQTEAVTYITQRTELLMGLFYFLTLYCSLRSWESHRPLWWSAAAVMSCILGAASKEVIVSAPLMVLLYDRTFYAGSFGGALRRSAWLYPGLAATWVLLAVLMLTGPAHNNIGFDKGISVYEYLLTQTTVLTHYLRLCFLPTQFLMVYENWPVAKSMTQVIPEGLLITGLLAATAWQLWRRHWLGLCGAGFFLILAPTSSFVPLTLEIGAERRMYLPLAAVIVPVIIGGFRLAELENRAAGIGRLLCRCLPAFYVIAVLCLCYGTVSRNKTYQDEIAVWSDHLATLPGSAVAHVNLCNALVRANRIDEAVQHGRQAVSIRPNHISHAALAAALYAQGNSTEAIEQMQLTIKTTNDRSYAAAALHANLAGMLAMAGRYSEAAASGRKALELQPDLAAAHMNMGYIMLQLGQWPEAVRHYKAYLKDSPGDMQARLFLAQALYQQNELNEAAAQVQSILAANPKLEEAHRLQKAIAAKLKRAGRQAP